MAIGDTLNQNPFGTDYNREEEERKKAELAAQNAMMGAGNVPASAFGQAPAVAPFSMEAAGQVNPMMQEQSLAVTPQAPNPATFLPYADDVAPPPASALSVFTPGGEVKPNVDVNAITPSPETTSTSAVNTALNQEVAVGSASVEGQKPKPRFFKPGGFGYEYLGGRLGENIGQFAGEQKYGTGITAEGQATGFPVDRPSLAGDLLTLPGTALNVVGDFVTDPLIAGSELAKDAASYATGATGVQAQQDAQAAQAALDLASIQGVTPPVETPSEGAQGQTAALDPTSDEAILANRAQREAQFAPTGGLTTVGGASLSEFLSGQAMPEQGFTQEESPLGGRGVTLTPDQMNALSAEREARLDARLPGDQSVSDRDRRAARGDSISMADQVAMAKANDPDATPREVARGNQVANVLGVDLKTGQPLQATGGLTFDQQLAQDKFELEQTKFIQSIIDTANAKAPLSIAQKKFAEEAGKGAYSWDQGGRQTSQENIGKFGQIIQDLEQGQLDTRTLSEFVPFGGDWWRSALNPTGQQGLDNVRGVIFQGLRDTLGAQFTEKEGERLVNAAYNPKLNEEQNIARLKPALARMKATFRAKEALTKHIMDGGDIREYKGKTPMDVYKSFDGQAGSGSPIPGDVDVDVQSNAQAILDRQ